MLEFGISRLPDESRTRHECAVSLAPLLLEIHNATKAVVLFGSVIRGQAENHSDVDLCVVYGQKEWQYQRHQELLEKFRACKQDLVGKYPFEIHLIILTEKDFLNDTDGIASRVRETGILLAFRE